MDDDFIAAVNEELWQQAHDDLCACIETPCIYPGDIAPYQGTESVVDALYRLGWRLVRA